MAGTSPAMTAEKHTSKRNHLHSPLSSALARFDKILLRFRSRPEPPRFHLRPAAGERVAWIAGAIRPQPSSARKRRPRAIDKFVIEKRFCIYILVSRRKFDAGSAFEQPGDESVDPGGNPVGG
jgi:hypothetical protein